MVDYFFKSAYTIASTKSIRVLKKSKIRGCYGIIRTQKENTLHGN